MLNKQLFFVVGGLFIGIHSGLAFPKEAGSKDVFLVEVSAFPQDVESRFLNYKVQKGNTLHFIAKQYGVTVEDILTYNPAARNGLQKGQVLRIPNKDYQAEVVPAVEKATEKQGTHTVQANETLYSLARRYQCDVADLLRLNPDAADGLRTGMVLVVPAVGEVVSSEETKAEPNVIRHTVLKGETIFGLARQYGLSIPELKQANPALASRGLVEGESLLIPAHPGAPVFSTGRALSDTVNTGFEGHSSSTFNAQMTFDCQPDPNARFQTYHVALLLPFYLTANDTINQRYYNPVISGTPEESGYTEEPDSVSVKAVRKIYPRSESFVQFYEGVLLAVDSLQQAGMKVKLHVYDTNQSAASVQSVLRKPELRSMNLLIGPVFPELQGPVAEFARANHIPMVSPLSAAGSFEQHNPYYYKVNPTKDYLIQETAAYLAEQFRDNQLFVLKMGDYSKTEYARLVEQIRQKRSASGSGALFREYSLSGEGLAGLKSLLSAEQPNVFIIPSETEAQVSVAITNLNRLSENYPVKLVGLSSFPRFKSIQTEYFHRVRLNVLNPYHINYQASAVNQFIRKFRRNFQGEPSQFSFQGYDIAFYFLSALYSYGGDFASCLPSHQVDLTQGEFYFEKLSLDGGYMNRGLFILEYEPDYSIQMRGVRGIPLK